MHDAGPRAHRHAALEEGRLEARAQAAHELAGRQPREAHDRPADPLGGVHRRVAITPAVAQEVAVDLAVVAVEHAPQLAVALAGDGVAATRAERADGRRRLQVPLARVVGGEGLVVEDADRADLDQVAAELAVEGAVAQPAEVDLVAQTEDAEIVAAGVVDVEAQATVALDAAVHLVGHERAQVVVIEGALAVLVAPVDVAGHHRHVLEMALAAFVAHWAVVRVAGHEQLDHPGAEAHGLVVGDGHPVAGARLGEAGHDDLALVVVFVPVELHGALPAGADRAHGRVPAEVGHVVAQGEADVEQVAAVVDLVGHALDRDLDGGHQRARSGARPGRPPGRRGAGGAAGEGAPPRGPAAAGREPVRPLPAAGRSCR